MAMLLSSDVLAWGILTDFGGEAPKEGVSPGIPGDPYLRLNPALMLSSRHGVLGLVKKDGRESAVTSKEGLIGSLCLLVSSPDMKRRFSHSSKLRKKFAHTPRLVCAAFACVVNSRARGRSLEADV
eukprot:CAMPEP_0114152264 /NCGR_PEP_ID=MMETSP0043_2-20121206/23704_1 /TAXON_ID=464988 /ORGANISM="Hemiselmis andersenii, Strain CCMP644" /LENGTH=125 /DNA_ID=CAMNT_0001247171 /DNA_START=32 /DNA_END=409 /DNA_ORIENTATION=-